MPFREIRRTSAYVKGEKKVCHENVFVFFIWCGGGGLWYCRCCTILFSHTLYRFSSHPSLPFRLPLVLSPPWNYFGTNATGWQASMYFLISILCPFDVAFSTQSKTCSLLGRRGVRKKNFDWMKYKSKQQARVHIQYLSCSQR